MLTEADFRIVLLTERSARGYRSQGDAKRFSTVGNDAEAGMKRTLRRKCNVAMG
jgi:hypothetical protein